MKLRLSNSSATTQAGAIVPSRPIAAGTKRNGSRGSRAARARAIVDDSISTAASSSTSSSTSASIVPPSALSSSVPRVRVFEKLASAVEIDAVVARFENLAGRVAMLSFLLAAGLEAAGGRPLFVSSAEAASAAQATATAAAASASSSSSSSSSLFAAGLAVAAALAAAAGAAASVRSRPGTSLLEPVVVSLTGAQRSLGAVSAPVLPSRFSFFLASAAAATAVSDAAAAVDAAVDGAVDSAFGAEFIAAVLGYGDDDVISP